MQPQEGLGDGAPLVSIVMGSDSDLKVMAAAAQCLEEFGVPVEVRILSAHRTPQEAADFARGAAGRGIRVIIAGAGLAAHLPGVLAAWTTLPVIGVPMASGPLQGEDALHAIVQMPPGVPVAAVGIDGARNAGLLAVQILAVGDPGLGDQLAAARRRMAEGVLAKDARLRELGYAEYEG